MILESYSFAQRPTDRGLACVLDDRLRLSYRNRGDIHRMGQKLFGIYSRRLGKGISGTTTGPWLGQNHGGRGEAGSQTTGGTASGWRGEKLAVSSLFGGLLRLREHVDNQVWPHLLHNLHGGVASECGGDLSPVSRISLLTCDSSYSFSTLVRSTIFKSIWYQHYINML